MPRELTDEDKLIQLGYGDYACAETSPVTRQPMLAGDGSGSLARKILDRLKVRWKPTRAKIADNEGRSTQAPMTPQLRLGRHWRSRTDRARRAVRDRCHFPIRRAPIEVPTCATIWDLPTPGGPHKKAGFWMLASTRGAEVTSDGLKAELHDGAAVSRIAQ